MVCHERGKCWQARLEEKKLRNSHTVGLRAAGSGNYYVNGEAHHQAQARELWLWRPLLPCSPRLATVFPVSSLPLHCPSAAQRHSGFESRCGIAGGEGRGGDRARGLGFGGGGEAKVATDGIPPLGATLAGWRSAIQGKMQEVKGNLQELNIPGKLQDLNLQGRVQELFSRDHASAAAEPMNAQSGGVLSAWNSYAARQQQLQPPEPASHGAPSRDLESGVPEALAPLLKSANSSITSAYNAVTNKVRELPANVQSAASFVPSRQALTAFFIMIAAGSFFIFMAFFMFLPVIVLVPQKFAISFTIGSIFIVGSFFALKGPKAQFYHMISKERWPFTAGFIGSMAATIYVSVVLHSYILSVVFAVIQVLALLYYLMSYFPGGTAGMQFLTSMILSSFKKCFGRLTSS